MLSRLQNIFFILLFLVAMGLLGWLAEKYNHVFDLTWGNRNSLTSASINALAKLDKPVSITAFARDDSKVVRDLIKDLMERYHQHKPDITLKFLNPDLVPETVREHGISIDGELLIQYGSRSETLKSISEKSLTQLLVKLAGSENSFVGYLTGHGERNLLGKANHDMARFGAQLENKGYILQPVDLVKTTSIPVNTRIMVIASPKVSLLEGELSMIKDYIEGGGNLLLLTEPEGNESISALLSELDLQQLPGVVVDATARLFGISDPTFALAADYPEHAITNQLQSRTMFPRAAGLLSAEESSWMVTPLLQTLPSSWTETGAIESGEIRFDEDSEEKAGPITIGMSLEKSITKEDKTITQRIVVVGDSDFLSNSYLGNGQNQQLGNAIFQWLNHNDDFIEIGTVSAPDTSLELSQAGALALLVVFLVLLPIGLLASGTVIWLKRRKR